MSIAKRYFPDSLMNHFPNSVYGAYRLKTVTPQRCIQNGRCGITLILNLSNSFIERLEDQISSEGLKRTSYSSNCVLIVNAVPDEYDCQEYLDSLLSNCSSFHSPLPNFPELINNSKLLIEQDIIDITKYDIYIIDSAPGVYLNTEYLTDGCGLPLEWENGYSRGFALNRSEKKAIFWIEVW